MFDQIYNVELPLQCYSPQDKSYKMMVVKSVTRTTAAIDLSRKLQIYVHSSFLNVLQYASKVEEWPPCVEKKSITERLRR